MKQLKAVADAVDQVKGTEWADNKIQEDFMRIEFNGKNLYIHGQFSNQQDARRFFKALDANIPLLPEDG